MLEVILKSALKAVEPGHLVRKYVPEILDAYVKGRFDRLLVAGFGKAAYPMAHALELGLGSVISNGLVITKHGHGGQLRRIRIMEAAHPVPDQGGVDATAELLGMLAPANEKTLVVTLISGGGSALLVKPSEGITLEEKRLATDILLRSGADIHELNTVRKHISAVKGGRLAEMVHPGTVFSLIISDVLGDDLDVIASGPTSPDSTTFADALAVIEKYSLSDKMPGSVMDVIRKGVSGEIRETPKESAKIFSHVRNIIIGNNSLAIEAASDKAKDLGLASEVLTSELKGEAAEAARWLARKAIDAKVMGRKNLCLISGGETTVTVKGHGKGGRNTELALAFSMEVDGVKGIKMLSAGTDGTDGPTDAAGAITDWTTASKARKMGIDPEHYLKHNDSYTFFKEVGGLVVTGPTGTNVMDIQVVLVNTEKD